MTAASAATAYAVVCLLCGRTFGHTLGSQFFVQLGAGRLERDGRRWRCGHCHDSILFEPDPTSSVAPTPAELLAKFRGRGRPGRKSRRAAG